MFLAFIPNSARAKKKAMPNSILLMMMIRRVIAMVTPDVSGRSHRPSEPLIREAPRRGIASFMQKMIKTCIPDSWGKSQHR